MSSIFTLLLLVFASTLNLCFGQCTFSIGLANYDFSLIPNATVGVASNLTYYISPCQILSAQQPFCSPGYYALQYSSIYCYCLGNVPGSWSVAQNFNGVQITYTGGVSGRRYNVEVECSDNEESPSNVVENPVLVYTARWKSKLACKRDNPQCRFVVNSVNYDLSSIPDATITTGGLAVTYDISPCKPVNISQLPSICSKDPPCFGFEYSSTSCSCLGNVINPWTIAKDFKGLQTFYLGENNTTYIVEVECSKTEEAPQFIAISHLTYTAHWKSVSACAEPAPLCKFTLGTMNYDLSSIPNVTITTGGLVTTYVISPCQSLQGSSQCLKGTCCAFQYRSSACSCLGSAASPWTIASDFSGLQTFYNGENGARYNVDVECSETEEVPQYIDASGNNFTARWKSKSACPDNQCKFTLGSTNYDLTLVSDATIPDQPKYTLSPCRVLNGSEFSEWCANQTGYAFELDFSFCANLGNTTTPWSIAENFNGVQTSYTNHDLGRIYNVEIECSETEEIPSSVVEKPSRTYTAHWKSKYACSSQNLGTISSGLLSNSWRKNVENEKRTLIGN